MTQARDAISKPLFSFTAFSLSMADMGWLQKKRKVQPPAAEAGRRPGGQSEALVVTNILNQESETETSEQLPSEWSERPQQQLTGTGLVAEGG